MWVSIKPGLETRSDKNRRATKKVSDAASKKVAISDMSRLLIIKRLLSMRG